MRIAIVLTAIIGGLLCACSGSNRVIQAPTTHETELAKTVYCGAGPCAYDVPAASVYEDSDTTDDEDEDDYVESSGGSRVDEKSQPNREFVSPYYTSSSAYCRNIMLEGQTGYKVFGLFGVPTTMVGVVTTAGFAAWVATDPDDKYTPHRVAIAGGGALVTAVGTYLIKRAVSAARASASAGEALALDDGREQWMKCLQARSTYLIGNAESGLELASKPKDAEGASKKSPLSEEAEAFAEWATTQCKLTAANVTNGKVVKEFDCSGVKKPVPPSDGSATPDDKFNLTSSKAEDYIKSLFGGVDVFRSLAPTKVVATYDP